MPKKGLGNHPGHVYLLCAHKYTRRVNGLAALLPAPGPAQEEVLLSKQSLLQELADRAAVELARVAAARELSLFTTWHAQHNPAVAAAAERLAGQVKYEKDVRWLGDNPHAYERHNRAWINMSASVLINTVKAAGLAILLCLGVGGLFGAIIFRRRRAQAALAQSYSDAGGMMRLDLDDHAAKLLGHGEK